MKKHELLPLLETLGVFPSRKLGQNFLIDANMLDAMVRDAAPKEGESILEVGPGTGVLTRRLLAAGCRVTAVEFDHRLSAYLNGALGTDPRLRLVQADACKLNYDELMGSGPWRCIANLPYSCSSVFLAKAIEAVNPPSELFVLLQLEMARRLAAKERTPDYGALTVMLQMLYQVEIVRRVPGSVFYPPPDVDSAFVAMRRRPDALSGPVRLTAVRVAKLGFGHRRKKLARLLEEAAAPETIANAFAALGISPDARAEELPVDLWPKLAARLVPESAGQL
jgi:16S rRNA (adenine1518-N6/adenine1519-N6)-dimethyltransferase